MTNPYIRNNMPMMPGPPAGTEMVPAGQDATYAFAAKQMGGILDMLRDLDARLTKLEIMAAMKA